VRPAQLLRPGGVSITGTINSSPVRDTFKFPFHEVVMNPKGSTELASPPTEPASLLSEPINSLV